MIQKARSAGSVTDRPPFSLLFTKAEPALSRAALARHEMELT